MPGARRPQQRVEFAGADRDGDVLDRPGRAVALADTLHPHFGQPDEWLWPHPTPRSDTLGCRAQRRRASGANPSAAGTGDTAAGGTHFKSVVATTSPGKGTSRAELTNPIASPEPRRAMPPPERGKTGAILSVCKSRIALESCYARRNLKLKRRISNCWFGFGVHSTCFCSP